MFTPLYNGIFSKWTMCREFQLTMARHPLTVAIATCSVRPAASVTTEGVLRLTEE